MSIPPKGTKPSNAQQCRYEGKKGLFHKLDDEWSITDNETDRYNCFAWSLGITSDWIDRIIDEAGNNNGKIEVSDCDVFYSKYGFKITENHSFESNKIKLALYAHTKETNPSRINVAAHVAVQINNDWWESKLGMLARIIHKLEGLEGKEYGRVVRYYEIDRNEY